MENVLEVKGLRKSFQKHFWQHRKDVLRGVNFSVPKNSITAFLGANGSGKTTAFKCLLRFLKKDSGDICFFKEPDFSLDVQARIGFLPEQPQFFEDLSLEELLWFYVGLTNPSDTYHLKKRMQILMKQAGLFENRSQRMRTFSKGMRQKVGLIQCILNKPELVLLDEPLSGLDLEGREFVFSLIDTMKKQGQSVFFSSHILPDAIQISDRFIIINEGKIVFQGNTEELTSYIEERKQIVFLREGKKQTQNGLKSSDCQEALKQLLKENCEIVSVKSEYQSLKQTYNRLIEQGNKNPSSHKKYNRT